MGLNVALISANSVGLWEKNESVHTVSWGAFSLNQALSLSYEMCNLM
jgi:hypothetical protein